jgi:hypothetical protein
VFKLNIMALNDGEPIARQMRQDSYLVSTERVATGIVIAVRVYECGFGGLACWPLVPKFAGSNPAEFVGFFGRRNPQHAFLRRGSEAVCPMSQFCGMLKNPIMTWKSHC